MIITQMIRIVVADISDDVTQYYFKDINQEACKR